MAEQKTNWYADYKEHCYIAVMQGGTALSFDAWMIQRADAVLSDLEAMRAERDDARSLLASATDLLNSWARESYTSEADRPEEIKSLIDRLWAYWSAALHRRDAELDRLRKALEDAQNWLYASERAWVGSGGPVDFGGYDAMYLPIVDAKVRNLTDYSGPSECVEIVPAEDN